MHTLAGHEVCDLPGPATVEANDAVVPYNASAAVAHTVDVQVVAAHGHGSILPFNPIFNRGCLFFLLGGGLVFWVRFSGN